MDRGFIKLYRKIADNPLWNKKPFSDGQAWVDLLLIANHKKGVIDKRGMRVNVNRGQVGYSVKALADRWGWSRGKVDRFLLFLEDEHQIKYQKTNVTTLITLINYEQYNENGQQNGQQTDTRRTPNGQQTDTNKKGENEKKKEIKLPDFISSESFTAFQEMRNKIKKPLTDRAAVMLVSKLEKFYHKGLDPNEILDNSTMNCWQGVFEPKGEMKERRQQKTFAEIKIENTKRAMLEFIQEGDEDEFGGQKSICCKDG